MRRRDAGPLVRSFSSFDSCGSTGGLYSTGSFVGTRDLFGDFLDFLYLDLFGNFLEGTVFLWLLPDLRARQLLQLLPGHLVLRLLWLLPGLLVPPPLNLMYCNLNFVYCDFFLGVLYCDLSGCFLDFFLPQPLRRLPRPLALRLFYLRRLRRLPGRRLRTSCTAVLSYFLGILYCGPSSSESN